MKTFASFSALVLMLFLSACSNEDTQPSQDTITYSSAWARATPPVATNGAAYLKINNPTDQTKTLIGASSTVSEKAEIHNHEHVNGMMSMFKVDELVIDKYSEINIAPGGYHIMLMGLKEPLVEGNSFVITLMFKDQSTLDVDVLVGELPK